MKISTLRSYIRFRKWGKYLITLFVFLIIYLFVGNHSIISFSHRRKEIKNYEQETRIYRRKAAEAQQLIHMLNNKDSTERYAREHYYMHNDNEDIYIVKE